MERWRIKNMTYQPIRVITKNGEAILRSRSRKGETVVDKITDQIKFMEKKGLIRISKVVEPSKKVVSKVTKKVVKKTKKTTDSGDSKATS
ncbi:hypothetical protein CL621_01495 [archaeon]|nr:hypothetical protein [archaeon]|tara:strand:- start:4978 stop:5247 length:270 start_codon:yes stop_codon:yes gene_type:complete